jgi:hypothetical protein
LKISTSSCSSSSLSSPSSSPLIVFFCQHLFVPSAEKFLSPFVVTQSFSFREICLWSENVGTWSWCFSFL